MTVDDSNLTGAPKVSDTNLLSTGLDVLMHIANRWLIHYRIRSI